MKLSLRRMIKVFACLLMHCNSQFFILVFAWEAYEKGADVHLQADPTKLELLAREFKDKKEKFKDNQKQSILERYGGEEHLDAPPKQLLMAQTVSDLDLATSLLTSHLTVTTIFRLTSEKYLKKSMLLKSPLFRLP